MGGALLRAALLQGPERAERRAVHAWQRLQSRERRVESEERRVQSGSEAAQSKTRRHRAQTEAEIKAETGRQILKTQFGFLFRQRGLRCLLGPDYAAASTG